jgi:cytochrome c oxidase assembly protein subunit 15
MEMINEGRYHAGELDTTAGQIQLQMVHRVIAVLAAIGVLACVAAMLRCSHCPAILHYGCYGWLGLIAVQFVLGVATVLTNKAADIATAHVAFGALTLLTGVLLAAMAWRIRANPETAEHASELHALPRSRKSHTTSRVG